MNASPLKESRYEELAKQAKAHIDAGKEPGTVCILGQHAGVASAL